MVWRIGMLSSNLVFVTCAQHGAVHRDCSVQNLMVEGSALYPKGSHPVLFKYTPDLRSQAPTLSKLLAPVKYYFVDFGHAQRNFLKVDAQRVIGRRREEDREPLDILVHEHEREA